MRKPKKYFATRGHLTAEGATKAEAKAKLEAMIDFACRNDTPKIEGRFGLIIVVAATANGWTHTIVDPADMHHGKERHCNCMYGQGEFTDALNSARNHAAQWAWNTNVADDAAFVAMAGLTEPKARELASWIAWQRRYAAAKANGATDNDAWNAASTAKIAA